MHRDVLMSSRNNAAISSLFHYLTQTLGREVLFVVHAFQMLERLLLRIPVTAKNRTPGAV